MLPDANADCCSALRQQSPAFFSLVNIETLLAQAGSTRGTVGKLRQIRIGAQQPAGNPTRKIGPSKARQRQTPRVKGESLCRNAVRTWAPSIWKRGPRCRRGTDAVVAGRIVESVEETCPCEAGLDPNKAPKTLFANEPSLSVHGMLAFAAVPIRTLAAARAQAILSCPENVRGKPCAFRRRVRCRLGRLAHYL